MLLETKAKNPGMLSDLLEADREVKTEENEASDFEFSEDCGIIDKFLYIIIS